MFYKYCLCFNSNFYTYIVSYTEVDLQNSSLKFSNYIISVFQAMHKVRRALECLPKCDTGSRILKILKKTSTQILDTEVAGYHRWSWPESAEWYIEDQAFLRSYDSAPRQPPLPHPPAIGLSFSGLPTGENGGRGGGGGAKSYYREKDLPNL